MSDFRFYLEPYKGINSRYRCPGQNCGKGRTFTRYIDGETGHHISPIVGRCNRMDKCGYHYTPRAFFSDNPSFSPIRITNNYRNSVEQRAMAVKLRSYIPKTILEKSLKDYQSNAFVLYLMNLFGPAITSDLIAIYFIGSSNHWNGSTVFWQIDQTGKIRTGKIMLYDTNTGRRIKVPFNHITWAHKIHYNDDFALHQCFFGEHLLKFNPTKPIAIVESEKTAIIATVYLPQFIWLATGSLTNLNEEKCEAIQGRDVILFPDINGYSKWINKADDLNKRLPGTRFVVSDLLEKQCSPVEKEKGLDLADFLIRYDWNAFIK